jgi:hypothetical protein
MDAKGGVLHSLRGHFGFDLQLRGWCGEHWGKAKWPHHTCRLAREVIPSVLVLFIYPGWLVRISWVVGYGQVISP